MVQRLFMTGENRKFQYSIGSHNKDNKSCGRLLCFSSLFMTFLSEIVTTTIICLEGYAKLSTVCLNYEYVSIVVVVIIMDRTNLLRSASLHVYFGVSLLVFGHLSTQLTLWQFIWKKMISNSFKLNRRTREVCAGFSFHFFSFSFLLHMIDSLRSNVLKKIIANEAKWRNYGFVIEHRNQIAPQRSKYQ